MGRVDGKAALVTGAAGGLGAAISRLLAAQGARVLLTDLDAEAVERVAGAIDKDHPGRAFAQAHDVTVEDDWQQALAVAGERLGGLQVLVNNAGVGSIASIEDESPDAWRRMHAVNLDSVFIGCRLAIPLLAASGGGAIVNLSSVSGLVAGHNLAAYNSTKAAVRHLSKSVALHCARARNGVRCNAVLPAFIDTPLLDDFMTGGSREELLPKLERQIPLGRIGRPEDVAYAVLYLASDESGFVTGSELVVDGGLSAA